MISLYLFFGPHQAMYMPFLQNAWSTDLTRLAYTSKEGFGGRWGLLIPLDDDRCKKRRRKGKGLINS
jgi:hypothetical protein